MQIRTVEDANALVGMKFGEGKDAREVTRVVGARRSFDAIVADVYWRRPGGKERSIPVYLPSFIAWARGAEKNANRIQVNTIEEVENELSVIPEGTEITGWVQRQGKKVTIEFEICHD